MMDTQEDTLSAVIADGIRFLESITRHYGTDEGQRIWEGIGNVVGPEVKGKIFFALLTGEVGTRVRFMVGGAEQRGNAVQVIKAIRTASGHGLKEAKDLWDKSKGESVIVECGTATTTRWLVRELKDYGCLVL